MKAKTTPSRFRVARMRRGLLSWQVADAVGIGRCRMRDIECGYTDAKTDEIVRLATFLRFPEAFFSRPHIDIPSIHDIN